MNKVTVYNMALHSIGHRDTVALPEESSREAQVCSMWYDTARDLVLKAAPWPVTMKFARLGVLAERQNGVAWVNTDPAPGWRFAYALPGDYLHARCLSTGEPFIISAYRGEQLSLMTQTELALLIYSGQQKNEAVWPAELTLAIAHTLGAYICLSLTGKPARAQQAAAIADSHIMQARVNAANESQFYADFVPQELRDRGYNFNPASSFYYPMGATVGASLFGGGYDS